jgi:hypothetical protein
MGRSSTQKGTEQVMNRLDTSTRQHQVQSANTKGTTVRGLARAGLTLAALVTLLGVGGPTAADAGSKSVRLQLIRIVCNETEDFFGDETYLQVNGRTIFEADMDDGDTQELGNLPPMKFRKNISLDLYDDDAPDGDDHLGTVTIGRTELGKGVQQATFADDDANYTLFYKVVK